MKWLKYVFIALNLAALFIPFVSRNTAAHVAPAFEQVAWPLELEGKQLQMIELSGAEKGFIADFPGAVGRFTDGSREVIVRILDHETRKLHPAADCLKGAGYRVKPMPLFVDREGRNWGRVEAARGRLTIEVREIIIDSRGNTWHDASSWFWACILNKAHGPFTAYVVSTPK